MIRKERKLEGGRSGSENGGKWISEQKEVFVQCSLERQKGCWGERPAGVQRAPSPHWEEVAGTHRHTFTRGGLILPGSAVSLHRVAMHEHTVMQAWVLGRERGEVPGLRRDSSPNCTKPRLHLTKAPHTLPIGNTAIRQSFQSIYKQPGMGMEGREEAQATHYKVGGQKPRPFSRTPEMSRVGLCFILPMLCVFLSTPADCRTICTLAEHF